MTNRIFINGMSLVAVKKGTLEVHPCMNVTCIDGAPLAAFKIEASNLKGFNVIARKLKIECDFNRISIKSALSKGELISVELHVDNCKFYGSFLAGNFKVSKKDYISFDAVSSGDVLTSTNQDDK